MSRSFVSTVLSVALTGVSFCVNAAPLGFSRNLTAEYSRIRLGEGAPVLAPFEHVRFCVRNPSECSADSSGAVEVELDDALVQTISMINAEVNSSIEPLRKTADYSPSNGWRIDPSQGDCNDYAVTKRHRLIEAGLPSRSLVLAVVKTASGEGHLVLVVKTTGGDFVLDNLSRRIRAWRETDYEWVSRQSSENPRFWVHVKANRAPAPVQLARAQEAPKAPAPLPFFALWAGIRI